MNNDVLIKRIESVLSALDIPREIVGDDFFNRTPARFADTLSHVFAHVNTDPNQPFERKIPHHDPTTIIVRQIDFYSMCEHHLLPFLGKVDIAYIPDKYILGVGQVLDLVNILTKRPQIQERLTEAIADSFNTNLHPSGIAVHISAIHLCSLMVTNEKEQFSLETFAWRGIYSEQPIHQTSFTSQVRSG